VHATETISADHPALAGHFPGHPIVPGVVLLHRVCRAVVAAHGRRIAAVPAATFHARLQPAETVEIILDAPRGSRIAFRVLRGEVLIASGTLAMAAPDE
jgi:3-hydroxymyristoyl/3-hydroxydecanoyl-(acyl carrier protein) dehydratase